MAGFSDIDNAINSMLSDQKDKNTASDNENKYKFEFDELQMYYGMDYKINDQITIKQPNIGEIIEFGEKKVYASIMPFVGNPTSYRLQLWDMGVDWNKISDFELFMMLVQGLKKEDTSLIFGDLDFSQLKPYTNTNDNSLVLANETLTFIIDEYTYMHIREYIRMLFQQYPKVEKAKGKSTKLSIIDEERMKIFNDQKNNKNSNRSMYLPLISALVNHPGFKYKKNELKECGIYEFMDSVKRLQLYESTRALMSGMYSGMLDTSKMDLSKELNWLRDLQE